uniref:Uncharacterized protein n=1 Tax=Cannabis sativa TaxID=3483 RepID=A0A803NRY6_CANSA
MAFLLPNLSPSLLLQSKSKEKSVHQTLLHTKPNNPPSLPSSLPTLQTPLADKSAQLNTPRGAHDKQPKDDFFVNLGLAVRTLREDLPLIFTKDLNYDIYRIWQPSENVILIRWNLKGVPRVPWEAKGQFQGTSRYKLDRNGKIYEHKVDNLAFNFPQPLKPAASVLDLVKPVSSPNPTFLWAWSKCTHLHGWNSIGKLGRHWINKVLTCFHKMVWSLVHN